MLLASDLDNTIINYEIAFRDLAQQNFGVPCEVLSLGKVGIRDFLNSQGRHTDFTYLQSLAYGPEIHRASLHDGFLGFLSEYLKVNNFLEVYSHKSQFPMSGGGFDLHKSSLDFVKKNVLSEFGKNVLRIKFFPDKRSKINAINSCNPLFFIDDLVDVLLKLNCSITPILFFGPQEQNMGAVGYNGIEVSNWSQLNHILQVR